MKKSDYFILGHLYSLLGSTSSDQLREASRSPHLSGNIKNALEHLAMELQSKGVQHDLEFLAPDNHATKPAKPLLSSLGGNDKYYRDQLLRLFSSKATWPTKQSLLEFARGSGLHVKVRRKDSRMDTAKAIVRCVLNSSESTMARVMQLLSTQIDPKTRGWMDLIRRSR
jgi:hypothetical protein